MVGGFLKGRHSGKEEGVWGNSRAAETTGKVFFFSQPGFAKMPLNSNEALFSTSLLAHLNDGATDTCPHTLNAGGTDTFLPPTFLMSSQKHSSLGLWPRSLKVNALPVRLE